MLDCVRITAGPCSVIEIGRGTMEIQTKGEDVGEKYPMPKDFVDFFREEGLTEIPTDFGKRNRQTTIRLEINCRVCTAKVPAHPNNLVSHVCGKHHVKTLKEWKKLGKDKEAKQCGRGPNASPSSSRIPRRHASVSYRASPYDRPTTSANRSYTGYNRLQFNSPNRASSAYDRAGPSSAYDSPGPSSAYDRPGHSSAYDRPGHSSAYDRPGARFGYDRPGLSQARREEVLSRMSSDSSSGSDDNLRTCRTYAEFKAMKKAAK